jgi:aspartyl/asparaginyl beta-hydroxylase (cupin superfamily)
MGDSPVSLVKIFSKRAYSAIGKMANRVFRWAANGDKRSPFYAIDQIKPELRILDNNFAAIRDELAGVLIQQTSIPRYHDISASETYISGTIDPDKNWRVFMLISPNGTPRKNQMKCPRTTELLAGIPGVVQAFFSILDPGKSIPAHCGIYLGYLRYHLALRVPENNPPSMRVRNEIHQWVEGGSVVFDDSLEHEVYNKSDNVRVVLIVDFLRPMNRLAHALNVALFRLAPHSEEAREVLNQIER